MANIKIKHLKGIEKIIGLINSQKAFPVLIITRFGIHTFGMKYNIDAVVLNRENIVVKITENLKPSRIFTWNPKHNKVIELPAGHVKKNSIKIGTQITLHE